MISMLRRSFTHCQYSVIVRSINTAVAKMDTTVQKAIIHQQSTRVSISFSYDFGTKTKLLNFNRDQEEPLSSVLLRVKTNVLKHLNRREKKRKAGQDSEPSSPVDCSVRLCKLSESVHPVVGSTLNMDKLKLPEVHEATTCLDAFVNGGKNRLLVVEHQPYILDVNPPTVDTVSLPENILAGFLLYPNSLVVKNASREQCHVKWFVSRMSFENYGAAKSAIATIEWDELSSGFFLKVDESMVNKVIKVSVTPMKGSRSGASVEAVSRCLVSIGPESFPFLDRHQYTKEASPRDSMRVVSYNILGDTYARTEYSAENLFAHCPRYALSVDYRKQLYIAEILGYNADVVCLQEVDDDIFKHDLSSVLLQKAGLAGEYAGKQSQSTKEGCATFFNTKKFKLVESLCFGLADELQNNKALADIFSKVKKNSKLLERILGRNTVLQACVLECLTQGLVEHQRQLLLVCNTHFYFHPDADHIRLLQAGIAFTLIEQLVARLEAAEKGCLVRVLVCGDLNSTPDTGVYQLATLRHVGADHQGWKSALGEEVEGVELRQTLPMASACGTPTYTNYSVPFQGCIDWIFYRTDSLRVENVVPMPSHEVVTEHLSLPSPKFPSDHLALVAQLTILEMQSSA
ncbi:Endonuclease/exonuclease/phosphatase [Trinorchestia longiramus]|nr:Endonuclease/exonuclease/phosphatase [Trinorchestia longiramus]